MSNPGELAVKFLSLSIGFEGLFFDGFVDTSELLIGSSALEPGFLKDLHQLAPLKVFEDLVFDFLQVV